MLLDKSLFTAYTYDELYPKEDPNIRANRTEKTKVIWPENPHVNKTPGHWETIQGAVEVLESYGSYEKIYVNNALSREIPGAKPNRPDIMAVRWDGTIDQFEVRSATDIADKLYNRMELNGEIMGGRAGKNLVIEIPKKKGWSMNGK